MMIPTIRRTRLDAETLDGNESTIRSDVASNNRKQGRNIDPQELFSDERRAELFQFLLRDLQVEGVPILAVDTADQWAPFQAALWTTMSTLYMSTMSSETDNTVENLGATKVCLVFEDTPMEYLRLFVQEFQNVQQHSFAASPKVSATGSTAVSMHHLLPELGVFEVSLLGNGVGPAILLAAKPHSSSGEDETTVMDEIAATSADTAASNEERMIESMERFVDRIVVQPKLKANNAGHHLYRSCRYGDAYHVMSSFWNAVCELERMHEQQQESVLSENIDESSFDDSSSMFLLLPHVARIPTAVSPVADGDADQTIVEQKRRRYHDRWYALTLVQSRSLRLNEEATRHLHIQQYYPDYDRDWLLESEDPTKERHEGHLPPNAIVQLLAMALHQPQESSRPILSAQELTTVIDSVSSMSDTELYQIINYLRRSPVPAVYLERRVGSSSLPDSNQPSRDDGTLRPVMQLLQTGMTLSLLQSSLDEEMKMRV